MVGRIPGETVTITKHPYLMRRHCAFPGLIKEFSVQDNKYYKLNIKIYLSSEVGVGMVLGVEGWGWGWGWM